MIQDLIVYVRGRGLEPPRIAPLVPKTSAATITPPTRPTDVNIYYQRLKVRLF